MRPRLQRTIFYCCACNKSSGHNCRCIDILEDDPTRMLIVVDSNIPKCQTMCVKFSLLCSYWKGFKGDFFCCCNSNLWEWQLECKTKFGQIQLFSSLNAMGLSVLFTLQIVFTLQTCFFPANSSTCQMHVARCCTTALSNFVQQDHAEWTVSLCTELHIMCT